MIGNLSGNFSSRMMSNFSALFYSKKTILYVGASVTAQSNTFFLDFHNRICAMTGFEHKFERLAVGGTGSILAYYTYLQRRETWIEQPVLVFFECFTGDLNGLVKIELIPQLLCTFCEDVRAAGGEMVIVNNYRRDKIEPNEYYRAYQAGIRKGDIPFINMYEVISDKNIFGSFIAEKVYRDGIHTTEAGSIVLSSMLLSAMLDCRGYESADTPSPQSGTDVDLLKGLSLQLGDLTDLKIDGDHTIDEIKTTPNNDRYTAIVISGSASISFHYTGFLCQLVFIAGPDSPIVDLSMLNRTYKMGVFDRNCYYRRFKANAIYKNLDERLSMKISSDPIDLNVIPEDRRAVIVENKTIRFIGALGIPGKFFQAEEKALQ